MSSCFDTTDWIGVFALGFASLVAGQPLVLDIPKGCRGFVEIPGV